VAGFPPSDLLDVGHGLDIGDYCICVSRVQQYFEFVVSEFLEDLDGRAIFFVCVADDLVA
jgi:hypothetical protein